MIHLKSMIDGFIIIIGGMFLNMFVPVAMVISIGLPPTYEDDSDKTTEALCTYIYLILYHIMQTAASVLLFNEVGAGSVTSWVMLSVVTIVLLLQR